MSTISGRGGGVPGLWWFDHLNKFSFFVSSLREGVNKIYFLGDIFSYLGPWGPYQFCVAPPTANTAPPTINVYSRRSHVYSRRSRVYSRRSRVHSRRSLSTVGGAHKRGRGTPLNGTGDDFFGGYSYFLSVSNDFSEKNGT